jgi:pseudaminic acid cytidylyltransferase
MMKTQLAIIPARGGSKRIPGKNIRMFRGKPMIAHAISAALDSGLYGEVIVSTDDDEIAGVAEAYGAKVPFLRSASLADDHAGILPVIQDAVRRVGMETACVTAIYATTPLLRAADLLDANRLWHEKFSHSILIPACRYSYPVQRAFTCGEDRRLVMLYPEKYECRSQDLPPVYHDAALFYMASPAIWLSSSRIYRDDASIMQLPADRVCDIDTPEDWSRAEFLAEWYSRQPA